VSVSQRGNRYGEVKDYMQVANEHMTVLVQVETRAAVAAASEIAAVDGVDGVFIGPSDLAAAYGHLGNPNHPEVQAAIAQVHAAATAAGKPTGILTPVEADARRYLAMGMRFVAVGSDLGVLRTQSRALAEKFREASGGALGAQY
jgi:2-dehydro-3-deoxyglucarate aldolase